MPVLPNGNFASSCGQYTYLRDEDLGFIGDPYFNVGVANTVTNLTAQSDNDVLIGTSSMWVYLADSSLVQKTPGQYNAAGSNTWPVGAVAVLPNGNVAVSAGQYIYDLDSDLGALGHFFDAGAGYTVGGMAAQSDNDVVFGTGRYVYRTNSILVEQSSYDAGVGLDVTAVAVAVPEPSSFVLLSIGLAACAWRRRRRQA